MKKFRVWDADELCWRDGCKMSCDGVIESSWGKDKHNWVVQFSIGSTDKNGKEIFEGDILKDVVCYGNHKSELMAVVKFGNPIGKYKNGTINCGSVGFYLHIFGRFDGKEESQADGYISERDWVIIGNIFENPDLLKS